MQQDDCFDEEQGSERQRPDVRPAQVGYEALRSIEPPIMFGCHLLKGFQPRPEC